MKRTIAVILASLFVFASLVVATRYQNVYVSKAMPGDPVRSVTSFVQPDQVTKPTDEAQMLDWIRRGYRYGIDDYRLADGTGLQLHYGADTWLTGREGQEFWNLAQAAHVANVRDCEDQAILACSWGRSIGLDAWVAVGYVDQWDPETMVYLGRSYHQWLMKHEHGQWYLCETTVYDDSTGPAQWEKWPLQGESVRYTMWYRYNERTVVHTQVFETGGTLQLPELTPDQVTYLREALQ